MKCQPCARRRQAAKDALREALEHIKDKSSATYKAIAKLLQEKK